MIPVVLPKPSAEMAKVLMRIKIDTREKNPYQFKTPSEVGTLSTGDYSICGYEDQISIERKSICDLIGSITSGRNRFTRELTRSRHLDQFHLVCEFSFDDIASGRYRSKASPESMVQSLIAFSIRFELPIWFVGSREHGQRITESLLCKYAKEVEKKSQAIS